MRYIWDFWDLLGPLARIAGPPKGYHPAEGLAECDHLVAELLALCDLVMARREAFARAARLLEHETRPKRPLARQPLERPRERVQTLRRRRKLE